MAKRKNYSTCSKIVEACRLYNEGTVKNLSLLAKQFGVDRKSLRERVKAKVRVDAHQGRETFLSSAVEKEISECLQVLCGWGWGFTRTELLDLVQDYILDSGLQSPFTNGRPGRKWFNRFMQDHPELSIRKSEQFPVARAQASADTGKTTHWFEVLKKEMDLAGVTTKPQNIYNVDETGFVTDASSAYVLARKGCRNVYQSTGGSGREQITTCITGNAAGHFLPPFIVYKGKHLYSSWCQGGPDHARFAVTEHGWMEKIVFLDYFTNLFLHESARLSDLTSPRILIFDGHTSHVSLSLAVKAKENNVVLLRLPSHLTHNLQPLDKAVFGEVKKQWQKKLRCHARVSRDKIRKEDFPQKLKDVLDVALKPKNIISGFESTGIYPFNPRCAQVGMESDTPFATLTENPLTTPPNMPLTTPPNMPLTTPPNMPLTTSPNMPLTTPPNMPLTTPPNMPLTTPPNMPLTTPPNMPLTTPPNMPLTTPRVHPSVPLSVPTVASVSQSTTATSPCLTAGDESASQITLSVETIPGSNILNITNIEIARPQSASSSFQNTSSKTSPTSNIGVKEFFLQRLLPKKNVPSMKRKRISILKYGESLTSEQALDRLNEAEKKKLNKQKPEKKKTKGTQGANSDKADNDIHEKENNVITDAFPIQRDAYYAVMFTMPAAYYVARALNESSPLHGETSFVMKFLDRGPNNTYNLPLREKIEDVERRFILCRANLESAGPFYLTNHNEVENLYKQKVINEISSVAKQ